VVEGRFAEAVMDDQGDADALDADADPDAVRTVADLSRVLRQLRRRESWRRGDSQLTYRELAAKTGWSRSMIGLYLSGHALPPTDRFDVLVQLLGATRAERNALAAARDRVDEARRAEPAGSVPRSAHAGAAEGEYAAVVPRALPPFAPHFTARQVELATLDRLLRARAGGTTAVAVITGAPGVGKTSLAVYWAHRVANEFPDGQVYLNLRGFEPTARVMDPAEATRILLDAMQVPAHRIPAGLDGQTALVRSILAGKRMLIVLDNARDAGQVRPVLPGTAGCLVLVTSRNELAGLVATDGAHPVLLDVLSPAESRELLARRLGYERVAAEPNAVDEIVTRCARLPLALAIVAARAAAHPDFELTSIAADLLDTRWAVLTGDDEVTDVRAVFSWSYHTLSDAAARLFRLLGLHPGPEVTAPAAASLAGLTVPDVRPLLSELSRAHLIAEHTRGRYGCHDLLRDYATALAGAVESDHQRRAATVRMLDHYLHSAYAADRLLSAHRDPITLDQPAPGCGPEAPADHAAALAWFVAEHAVLLAVVNRAASVGLYTHTWQLGWTLTTYLDRQGHWQDWITTGTAAARAAGHVAGPSTQALAHRLLARAYSEVGRIDETQTHLQQALELVRRSGDLVGQAHTQLYLSDLWERQGRHAEALDHAQRALALYEEAGHRRGQTDALNTVGWCEAQLGAYEQAIVHCQQALRLHQDLGPGIVQATTWDSLGYAHHHLGDHAHAVECYQRAIDMFRDLGVRHDEAESLTRLGEAHQAAGDRVAANDAWQQALAILEGLDHPDAEALRARLEPDERHRAV
jgi:tetratricopeptide (TPR) repeat protein